MKKFASGSILAYQASACGETQQSRYEASSVGNRVTDGKADTLATAGTAKNRKKNLQICPALP